MKRVLITGASGFLGSNITKALSEDAYDVALTVRNETNLHRLSGFERTWKTYNLDAVSVQEIIDDCRPEIVIHCATDYGRKNVSQMQVIEANLILPLKLLHFSKLAGVKKFVNTDTFLDKRINHYSLSKKQFRDWFRTFENDMLCINMILEHFYGPLDDKTKFVSGIIHDLLTGKPSIDLTPGAQKRNFIFIDDVVRAFKIVLEHDFEQTHGFTDFFIASEKTIAIKDLVTMLKQLSGNNTTDLRFGAIPYRANEVMDSSVDISAMKMLGWQPQVDLETGLNKTIEIEKAILASL